MSVRSFAASSELVESLEEKHRRELSLIDSFLEFFERPTPSRSVGKSDAKTLNALAQVGLEGHLRDGKLRSLFWKVRHGPFPLPYSYEATLLFC